MRRAVLRLQNRGTRVCVEKTLVSGVSSVASRPTERRLKNSAEALDSDALVSSSIAFFHVIQLLIIDN